MKVDLLKIGRHLKSAPVQLLVIATNDQENSGNANEFITGRYD
jgi:hypothetical protein